jgi:hypothetical protein
VPVFLIPAIAAALPTIGPIALAGAGAGYGVITWGVATVLAYTVTTAATLGASLLLNQQKKPKGDPQQVTVKQSLPPRIRSYGQVKIGGAFGFVEAKTGSLYQLIIHGEGEWTAIDEYWLNDKNADVSGGLVGVLPWGSNISIESHLGAAGQTASPALVAAFPGVWTSDHRLRGLAYSVVILRGVPEKVFSKVYPNGAPALRVVARTSKVYDPRTGVTAYSENAALCIRDYLTYGRGFGIAPALIDEDSFAAFADICGEAVPLAAGGTEPRYRVSFTYDLTQEPREVLRQLLQSCDAEIYPTASGKVGIRGGAWQAAAVTLTEVDIRTYRYEQGNDKLAAFNRLKLTFTDRAADYQPVEIDPWEDLASQADVGVLQQDMTLQQVPSWTQARRLGKIFSARSNPRHRLELQTSLSGIRALGERCVHIVLAELGIDDDFLIERFEIAGDLSGCSLTLASLSAAAYAWNPATEEGTPPTVPADTDVPVVPPVPTGLALALVRTEVTGGVFSAQVSASVNPIAGSAWDTVGRYRKVGAPDWINMLDDGDWKTISGVLDDGADYEVQAAHTGWGGINSQSVGAWTASELITAVADGIPPDPVSGLGAAGGGSVITVSWSNPVSTNFFGARIYRGTSAVFGSAAVVGTVYGAPGAAGSFVDSGLGAGTYYYWIVALNRSGAASAAAGPVFWTL